jgi:hypothetical protein
MDKSEQTSHMAQAPALCGGGSGGGSFEGCLKERLVFLYVAGDKVLISDIDEGRDGCDADLLLAGTAGVEMATGRRMHRAGHVSL